MTNTKAAIWWLRNCTLKPIGKLNWLFRSIRWRVVAAYNIGWWVMFLGAPMKDWIPIGNRGEVIKWAWEFYRGQEFPRIKLSVAEVMPLVTVYKDSSIKPEVDVVWCHGPEA